MRYLLDGGVSMERNKDGKEGLFSLNNRFTRKFLAVTLREDRSIDLDA